MILCLDVGNSQIHGGIFKGDELLLQFRKQSKSGSSSDEFGLFLKSVLRENGFDPEAVEHISICSVVPESNHSIFGACQKYFDINPFLLKAGVKTGLKIKYANPVEVGADRIANAVAATHLYPNTNLMVIDFGTATTFCAITKSKEYLGGCIIAGMRISMEALESQTSKLPSVELKVPEQCVGRSTVESIQSGLYYGTVGAVREITHQFSTNVFKNEPFTIIGTGGFARLLQREKLFDVEDSTLVLKGLYLATRINSNDH